MSEAPKRIWVWNYAADQMVNEKPDSTDVLYVRGDIVEEMRDALEGVLPYTLIGTSEEASEAISRAIRILEEC